MEKLRYYILLVLTICIPLPMIAQGEDPIIKAATNGDIDAQIWLAKQYFEGSDRYHQNMALSYKWYHEAAVQGDAEGQYALGTSKEFTPEFQTQEEADVWLLKAADNGMRFACLSIGQKFCEQEDPRALTYLEKAVPLSNIDIGKCYWHGIGTEKNIQKAKEIFSETLALHKEIVKDKSSFAAPVVAEAYKDLCCIYLEEHNLVDAAKNAELSADFGNEHLYGIAGDMNLSLGNINKSRELYTKLAETGNPQGYSLLGNIEKNQAQWDKAVLLYEKALAIDNNEQIALSSVGWAYYMQKNFRNARMYAQRAVQENIIEGYELLAKLYSEGYGVEKNINESVKLISSALLNVEKGSSDYYSLLETKGEYLIESDRIDEAKSIWNEIKNNNPEMISDSSAFMLKMCDIMNYKVGQGLIIEEFFLDEKDLSAILSNTMISDQNGETCALIKIVTNLHNLSFNVGSLGVTKTEQRTGEVWVYVPHGIKRVSIAHPIIGSIRDYSLPITIESGKTYVLKLK